MFIKRALLCKLQAQFPNSKGAQDDGYSHCPGPATEQVREKLLELAPRSLRPLDKAHEAAGVSMWGSTASMVRTSYDVLGLASMRFNCKGSREITCITFTEAEKMMETICDKEELVPPTTASPDVPLLRSLATFLHDRLDAKGLAHIADLPGLAAYRATCPPGSLLYLPSGTIFSERSLNGALCFGWRLSVVESEAGVLRLKALLERGGFGPRSQKLLASVISKCGSSKGYEPKASNGDVASQSSQKPEMLALPAPPPQEPQVSQEAKPEAKSKPSAAAESSSPEKDAATGVASAAAAPGGRKRTKMPENQNQKEAASKKKKA